MVLERTTDAGRRLASELRTAARQGEIVCLTIAREQATYQPVLCGREVGDRLRFLWGDAA